jgi:type III pantothenate kinase
MLLAIDIGNSSTKFGLFDLESLVSRFAISTQTLRSTGRIAELPGEFSGLQFEDVIVSSVVPELNDLLSDFSETHFGIKPIFIDHLFDFGFEIKYEPPTAAGIDRLVAASAAVQKYGKPCIVCDFGTAATIDAVNSAGQYLGGVITPGITTLSHALFQKTSKLPEIDLKKPDSVIGRSTVQAIGSGIYYGYIGLVEGLLKRVIDELGEKPKVIATGGFAEMIASEVPAIEIVDKDLLLEGLQMIHSKMKNANRNRF